MTPETKLIWDKINQVKRATVVDMIGWTGRTPRQAGVTIGLMVEAGQLQRIGKDFLGKTLYGPGKKSTFREEGDSHGVE